MLKFERATSIWRKRCGVICNAGYASPQGRFEDRIRLVIVRLLDVNGPRGGIDKQCRIKLELIPSGNLVIHEASADLAAAIDRGADRIGHAISRKLHREKELRDVSSVGT